MELAVEVSGIGKSFGSEQVLNSLSLSVESGSSVALLGANGSGKSTFLRTLSKLLSVDSGTVRVFGEDLNSLKAGELRALRQRVGVIFQKHNLVPRLCALTNVIHGALGRTSFGRAWFHSLAPKALREEAYHCLERVGLAEHALKQVLHLSGGQSQRVAVARMLMQKPEIILADEPVASLDPEAGEQVMQLLRGCNKEHGNTLIFTSHHLHHALEYADRIVGLESGSIHLDDRSEAFTEERLYELYE